MKLYTEKLHEELLEKLEALNKNYLPLNLFDQRMPLITDALDGIKEKLNGYQFKKPQEEVEYFRDVLPATMAMYFYYKDRIEWERIAHLGTDSSRYKFHDRIYSQS